MKQYLILTLVAILPLATYAQQEEEVFYYLP